MACSRVLLRRSRPAGPLIYRGMFTAIRSGVAPDAGSDRHNRLDGSRSSRRDFTAGEREFRSYVFSPVQLFSCEEVAPNDP